MSISGPRKRKYLFMNRCINMLLLGKVISLRCLVVMVVIAELPLECWGVISTLLAFEGWGRDGWWMSWGRGMVLRYLLLLGETQSRRCFAQVFCEAEVLPRLSRPIRAKTLLSHGKLLFHDGEQDNQSAHWENLTRLIEEKGRRKHEDPFSI